MTKEPAPFNLRHVVRRVLDESSQADPGALAGLVFASIPSEHVADALEETLRLYVRQVISEQRVVYGPKTVAAATPHRPSVKVAAIRDGWQRRLHDRVHVGGSEWKLLGECSADELDAVAAERDDLASRNASWARTYRAWAALVRAADVKRFADLPAETLMQALGAAS